MRISRVLLILSLCSLVAIFRCSKNPASSEPTISISTLLALFEPGQTTKNVTIGNKGGGELTWSAIEATDMPWLSIYPDSGQGGDQLTITINPANLNGGTHNASIQITSNGGDENLSVSVLISELLITPDVINFESSETSKELQIQNLGAGNLYWTISTFSNTPWLSLSSSSGKNAATVTLTVDRSFASGTRISESLLINSTGGNQNVSVSATNLPSSIVLEEFSDDLLNWDISDATGSLNNGFLELTGNNVNSIGQAGFELTSTRAAPWTYRVAFGRKNDFETAQSSIGMITDDDGTIMIIAFRFDVTTDPVTNWIAAGFVYDSNTGNGVWGHFENGFGHSTLIKTNPGEINDISWVMKPSKEIEIYVDGSLFFQTNELLALESTINEEITTGLAYVFIWATYNVTTIADWALIRDVDSPSKIHLGTSSLSGERRAIIEYARKKANDQFKNGSWQNIPSLKEVIQQFK